MADDPTLAAKLQDPELSAEQKQGMLNQLTYAAMEQLGYDTTGYENKIIAKDNELGQGFYSEETGHAYINDHNLSDTEGLVMVAGHEMSHAMDDKDGSAQQYSKQDQETYAENIGNDFADYTDTALGVSGYGDMAKSNSHIGNEGSTVATNNSDYQQLDKSQGSGHPVIVAAVVGLEVLDKYLTAQDALELEKAIREGRNEDVQELATELGIGFATEALPGNKVAIKFIDKIKDVAKGGDKAEELGHISKSVDGGDVDLGNGYIGKPDTGEVASTGTSSSIGKGESVTGTGGTDKSVGDLATGPPGRDTLNQAYSGKLVKVDKPDADADMLATRIGGQSRVKFEGDLSGREFDVVSDTYVGQAKPANYSFNKKGRGQARATFEAAKETGREMYYHFDGSPDPSVIKKLNEYSERYNVPVTIDVSPF